MNATSAAVYDPGGTKKSVPLTALPVGVVTEIGPEVAPAGTRVIILVAAAEVTAARVSLNLTLLSLKLLPMRVTLVPELPTVGVNPVITGTGLITK